MASPRLVVRCAFFTGAPMPADADTVYMQEDVRAGSGEVALPPGLARGANMRPAGEDVARGARIIEAGRRLRPQDVALAAAAGLGAIDVRQRLRVAVFSTGNELAEPGTPLARGAIHDSNRIMLIALLTRLGASVMTWEFCATIPPYCRGGSRRLLKAMT
jgi:molybdopterin molybdotransferase